MGGRGVYHIVWCALALVACSKKPTPQARFECGDCHRAQVEAWSSSHHAESQRVADGGYEGLPVRFVIGVEPVQQPVVELAPGNFQVAPTAPTSLTGAVADWRGPRFNWSGSCAPCHATGFQVATNTWRALNVACEACHVGVDGHRAWLDGGVSASAGFSASLKRRNEFHFVDGGAIARAEAQHADSQTMACAQCHQRRRALVDDGAPVAEFFDAFEPELMRAGAFEANGAMKEEVFESASFLMSKMQRAGVRCSHCHEPHSGKLRAQGNAVCAQCHRSEVFDVVAHRGQQQCVDCHMPKVTFLGVDERRDHAFLVPGRRWPAFEAAFAGNADANTQLLSVIRDTTESSFKRASALALLRAPLTLEETQTVADALASDDEWLRYGAASALPAVAEKARAKLGELGLQDERRAMRVKAARALRRATAELKTAEAANAFSGDSWLNLGSLEHDPKRAAWLYRKGLEIDPAFVPLAINLADVSSDEGPLREAVKQDSPWVNDARYALGLAAWRRGEKQQALEWLRATKDGGVYEHCVAWALAENALTGADAGCGSPQPAPR